MKTTYLIKETPQFRRILEQSYRDLLVTVPQAQSASGKQALVKDFELFKLHDLVALMHLGHLNIRWMDGDEGRVLVLEVVG